jgi:hypothetical protein
MAPHSNLIISIQTTYYAVAFDDFIGNVPTDEVIEDYDPGTELTTGCLELLQCSC